MSPHFDLTCFNNSKFTDTPTVLRQLYLTLIANF